MKTRFLSLALIISSGFIFSACTLKDQLKTKILDKVDQKVQEEKSESTPTDDQLLQQIDASPSTDIDAEFKKLEDEIK